MSATDNQSESKPYQVVARKYRPQQFDKLIGQHQVVMALCNAIEQERVGHAYLFTGARGVGKTSAARIFAKCLNCVQGPTIDPCHQCDICLGVAAGDEIDVLEIDGASNRGIEEIRQLRANVNVRPSRATYKIYIIDEVHMLTTPAFNALLKTLEEPPAHVKFIFCTTDPEKMPVTVLSRCQRFDFLPISTVEIQNRLQEIVEQEGGQANSDALELLARRAGGSMRDSQSLLEQLLALTTDCITIADVHMLLGTADFGSVIAIVQAIINQQTGDALQLLDEAICGGVDASRLTEQILGLCRDLMAAKVGGGQELMLHTTRDDWPAVTSIIESLGLESILAILQAFDQTLVRMRQSTHGRTLLEAAVVRACHLENLDRIPELVRQLQEAELAPRQDTQNRQTSKVTQTKKKETPLKETPLIAEDNSAEVPEKLSGITDVPAQPIRWDEANLPAMWSQVMERIGDITSEVAANCESIELGAPDQLLVTLKSGYDRDICQRPERKKRLEQALFESTGKKIRLEFSASQTDLAPQPRSPASKRQRIRRVEQEPFVRKAIEIFDAEITEVTANRRPKHPGV